MLPHKPKTDLYQEPISPYDGVMVIGIAARILVTVLRIVTESLTIALHAGESL